jgi:hypothetical protein
MTVYGYVPSPLKGDGHKEDKELFRVDSNGNIKTPDLVNSPSHYQGNGIEVIDIIEAFGLNFSLGNSIKYILRADKKGNKKQDIQKAIWYLNNELKKFNG